VCYNLNGESMKKQILYLDILRIIACFLVIVNHTHKYILVNGGIINTIFYVLGFSVSKIGVPIFLMITGVLVLNKDYNYKKVLKNIFRVIVLLMGLSFFIYFVNIDIKDFNILIFLNHFFTSNYSFSFWYLYALIGLYLVIPFLQKMIKNFSKKDYIYFVFIFLLVPSIFYLLDNYFNFKLNTNITSSFFPSIVCIPICGEFLSKVKLDKKYFNTSLLIFCVSFLGMFCPMFIPYLKNNNISYVLDSWDTLPVLLMSVSFFYIMRYLYENKKINLISEKLIFKIASTTFGIYLIHTIINYRIYDLYIVQKIFLFNEILGVVILEILVFIICGVIIFLLKKLPIIKKFL